MKTHLQCPLGMFGDRTQEFLLTGQAASVSPWPGELTVVDGRIWLTRRNDLADHVLERGRSLRLAAGQVVVIEALDAAQPARVRWQRVAQPAALPAFAVRGLAAGLRVLAGAVDDLARGLRGAEVALAARARSAASSASLAQGNMACGESMASCGAVK
jgi:hypothetical protein